MLDEISKAPEEKNQDWSTTARSFHRDKTRPGLVIEIQCPPSATHKTGYPNRGKGGRERQATPREVQILPLAKPDVKTEESDSAPEPSKFEAPTKRPPNFEPYTHLRVS